MCNHGETIKLLVPIMAEDSYTGKFRWETKPVDKCLAPYIQAFNDAGLYTRGCCCGHRKTKGTVVFHDGTVIMFEIVDYDNLNKLGSLPDPSFSSKKQFPEVEG